MDPEMKLVLTDPLLKELATSRGDAESKPKTVPIHILKDVTATMAKINQEVRLQ